VTSPLSPEQVLSFWFGAAADDRESFDARMHLWFEGGRELDQHITREYGLHVQRAAQGEYDHWLSTARGTLALLILLDQFPRHIHRGSAAAFGHDARARAICVDALVRGVDRLLHPVERQFFYLPLQHAESLPDQEHCVALFTTLLEETPEDSFLRPHFKRAVQIARFHAQVIARYGRYPHRNRLLGRNDTLAEAMYLDAGGPTFGQEGEPQHSAADRHQGDDGALEFRMYSPRLDPSATLCVDGNVFGLRCLSHWPGSVVPPELSHELSTGMALRYARLPRQERTRLLGRFSVVTNDHYDTDGALAAFALLSPELALAHADLLLRTAATGDFRTFQGPDALALDLTVWALRDSERSPLRAQLAHVSEYDGQAEAAYHFVLGELPRLLTNPFAYQSLWSERHAQVVADIEAVERGHGIRVQSFPEHDLAVLFIERPFSRHGLVHASGGQYRVLVVHHGAEGFRYRFFYRNESWFLGARDRAAPRVPLEPMVRALAEREGPGEAHWWCQTLEQTSPELGFGLAPAPPNVFGDIRPERDPCSKLRPHQVVQALISAFTDKPASLASAHSTEPSGPLELP
jgi:uncharacterized protein (DUF924 family)